MSDNLAEACKLLGLSEPLTQKGVTQAYAERVKQVHPDTAHALSGDASEALHRLRWAKRVCLEAVKPQRQCPTCRGAGWRNFGEVWPVKCLDCDGKGVIEDVGNEYRGPWGAG